MASATVWMMVILSASGVEVQMPTTYYSAEDCQSAARAIAQAHPGSRGSCMATAAPPGLAKQQAERDWQTGRSGADAK